MEDYRDDLDDFIEPYTTAPDLQILPEPSICDLIIELRVERDKLNTFAAQCL